MKASAASILDYTDEITRKTYVAGSVIRTRAMVSAPPIAQSRIERAAWARSARFDLCAGRAFFFAATARNWDLLLFEKELLFEQSIHGELGISWRNRT
jgi:hypothetical protein